MRITQLQLDHVRKNVQMFNSGPHPSDALLTTMPLLGIQAPPDTSLTHYGFWYPCILGSQHRDRRDVKTVGLTPSYARLLIDASTSARITGQVPETHRLDLLEPGLFNQIFQRPACPKDGYFLRFDTASVKDTVNAHRGGVKSPIEVIERLVTSQRAVKAIDQCLVETRPISIYFVPFDRTFDPRNDQRRWTERGRHRPSHEFMSFLLQRVQHLHHHILDYAKMWDPEIAQGLRDQGFVFHVRYLAGIDVQLIGLTEFGIASRCGSALFHWLTDAELLYGGRDEVEMRVVARKTNRERVRAWKWASYLGSLFRAGTYE
ncbi:hypothetical protein GJ744_005496 [Endocarpon pusillum]|uniref:Uncharacterized protein n=1 Tax=Endocarpon pusillum TaxID=364733 RepID=A0A8H7DYC8_9EURO|nr:hypothetical protein GJ744_005496 [Endocarpon pusillum]